MNFVTNYRLAGITEHPILKNLNVGGAVRWEDQASIGFYGAAPDADGIVRSLDPAKPVWDQARAYFDLQSGYDLKLFAGKVRTRVQLNVRNLFESGRLQRVSVNPDGGAWAYRIIDPRQFILTATFSLRVPASSRRADLLFRGRSLLAGDGSTVGAMDRR